MKKNIVLTILILMFMFGCSNDKEGKIILTMGSWRTDDVLQMNGLFNKYTELNPNVEIQFKPTNPPDYNATLRSQLESGTGPDIIYARSYDTGRELFEDGSFADMSYLTNLQENFSNTALDAWKTLDGKSFAVPFMAVSHGIYYNEDILRANGVTKFPDTWEDFLMMCQKLNDAGLVPIANGLGDEWDINEVVFMSLLPNFIGGSEGRLAYESGQRPFNDEAMVKAFDAMKDLSQYLPRGYSTLTYNDAIELFATGQAAMYFDGSWSLSLFNDVAFKWSVAPVPPPEGSAPHVVFHVDAGLAMNPATKYPKEVEAFLEWLTTKEGVTVATEFMPLGMFSLINNPPPLSNKQANNFLSLNSNRSTDVRFTWPKLMAGEPSAYQLLNQSLIKVMTGLESPEQAADNLANGLATWYRPTI